MSEKGNQGKSTRKSEGQKCWTKLKVLIVVAGFVAAIITIKDFIVPIIQNLIFPPPPTGLVIFDADQWHEEVVSGKKEIVCQSQTGLNVTLQKVGIGMDDATVERCLTYSKPKKNALGIEYEFTGGKEIGAHFLIHGFRKDPSNFIRLDEYGEGYVFLRVKPMSIGDATNTDDYSAVSFGLKLEQGKTSLWDNKSYSCARGKRYWLSGWHDIQIPIKPYLDKMRNISSTVSEPLRLEQIMMIYGDTYASPRRGQLWLNAIMLVKKEMEPD